MRRYSTYVHLKNVNDALEERRLPRLDNPKEKIKQYQADSPGIIGKMVVRGRMIDNAVDMDTLINYMRQDPDIDMPLPRSKRKRAKPYKQSYNRVVIPSREPPKYRGNNARQRFIEITARRVGVDNLTEQYGQGILGFIETAMTDGKVVKLEDLEEVLEKTGNSEIGNLPELLGKLRIEIMF